MASVFHKLKYSVWCRRRLQQTYAACVCWPQKQRCVLLPIAVRHSSTRPPPWEAEPSLPARPLLEGLALLLSTQSGVSLHTIWNRLLLRLSLTLAWLREHRPPDWKFSSLSPIPPYNFGKSTQNYVRTLPSRSWVSNLFRQRPTAVNVGWFAVRTCKNHYIWYKKPLELMRST